MPSREEPLQRMIDYPLAPAYSKVKPERRWELGVEVSGEAHVRPGAGAERLLDDALEWD